MSSVLIGGTFSVTGLSSWVLDERRTSLIAFSCVLSSAVAPYEDLLVSSLSRTIGRFIPLEGNRLFPWKDGSLHCLQRFREVQDLQVQNRLRSMNHVYYDAYANHYG